MTTMHRPVLAPVPEPAPTTPRATRPARAVVVAAIAVAAGLALGVGDLLWELNAPARWAGLANTSAPWAVGAFALGAVLGGRRFGLGPAAGAAAAVLMQVVAVESYYAAASLVGLAALSTLWAPVSLLWVCFGVVAGLVWGSAGVWFRTGRWWRAALGLGSAAGVLLGEAAMSLYRTHAVDPMGYGTQIRHVDHALIALGVAVLLLGVRRPVVLATAALVAVPASMLCAAAFTLAGFGG